MSKKHKDGLPIIAAPIEAGEQIAQRTGTTARFSTAPDGEQPQAAGCPGSPPASPVYNSPIYSANIASKLPTI